MFKMLQITQNISWSKESALQSQAMENTAWHILAPKMEPLGLYLSTHNKAGFQWCSVAACCSPLALEFGKREEHSEFIIFQMHCTRKALSIWSALIVRSSWSTEMAQQLCQIWFCALKRPRQALRWLKCWLWQPNVAWFAFKRLRWGHHTAGTATGWKLKPRNGDFPV